MYFFTIIIINIIIIIIIINIVIIVSLTIDSRKQSHNHCYLDHLKT